MSATFDESGAQAAFDRVARTATKLLGVPIALVTRLEPERQVFLGLFGLGGGAGDARQTPISHSFCRHVVATARPLVVEDARTDERVRGNPAIDELGVIAYAGYPLYDGADPVGAFCAIDTEPRRWSADELELVRDLAAMAQSELDLRASTRAARAGRAGAEEANEVLRRLTTLLDAARAGAGLEEVLTDVVSAAGVALEAPAAFVALADDDGRLRVRACVGLSPDMDGRALPVESRLADAVLGSQGVLAVDAVEDTVLAGEGMHAALGASLAAEGRAPGLLVIADRVPRDWTELERRLVQLAADRLGHVFERTRIADEQHDVAERLQRALEPTELPRRPGVRLAARYRPAERRIGGDWYDAFALPGGRVGIAIGDVVGHGIAAAAAAVRLRHFLRGCVLEGLEPGEALAALDAQVASEPDAAYSSVIYGVLDPGARTLVWASAGHPPPVLLRDGAARPLKSRGGSLLGVRPTGEWPESRLDLRDGDRIVLYTDGLVERPGVPIDEDIAAVFAPMGEEDDLERLCHGLVAARSAPVRDDVAVLAVRVG